MKLALATYDELPHLAADDVIALEAFRRRGIDAQPWIWDGGGTALDFDAVVIRCLWDYHKKRDKLLEWLHNIETSGTPLLNPADVIRWNLNKQYLEELRHTGISVPRTMWLAAGNQTHLSEVLDDMRLDEAVVKPAVGIWGFDTWRVARATASAKQRAFDELTARLPVMIQEFVPEVLSRGELSFMFFAGAYHHCVRKLPSGDEFRIHEENGGTTQLYDPRPELIREATAIAARAPGSPAYLRVDGIEVGDRLVLMELELFEPTLYFAQDPRAADRYVDAILCELGVGG